VRAVEEPNLPAPLIDLNASGGAISASIDYQGEPLVQECMEYYLDKTTEEARLREYILRRERAVFGEADVGQGSGSGLEQDREPSGVVTYLLMENSARSLHKDLLLSLHCLGTFFGRYPVVVFHTNASTAEELDLLKSASPEGLRLEFEEVHLDFPADVLDFPGGVDGFLAAPQCVMDGQDWWLTHRSCGCRCPAWRPQCWPLNWMHATRFFTAGMFRTRTFQRGEFDFFLRLDTDLFFVEAPAVDPFRLMAERGCGMVYDAVSREAPGCFDGFDEMVLRFFQVFGYIGSPDLEILHVGRGPAAAGGQWTLGDARLFSSDRYLRFADFAAGGIYRHRWADQLFLLRGLALFGPRSGSSARPRAEGEDPPPVSICLRSLFPGGTETGFVHKKGGFQDSDLLQRCSAPDLPRGTS